MSLLHVTIVTLALQAGAPPSLMPPNGILTIAYRQRTEGRLSDAVHQAELQCWGGGRCQLVILTLNQCMESSQGPAFYPKVQISSTDDGDLRVTRTAPGTVKVEQTLDGTVFVYLFSYAERVVEPKPQSGGPSHRVFGRLTGFSGSAVKTSDILGKVISWDLVPFKGESAFVSAKCQIMLDGVP